MSFFHFTLQGLIGIGIVSGFCWRILKILRRWDDNFVRFMWQHEVMWNHHQLNHAVPVFPSLTLPTDRRSGERRSKQSRFDEKE